MNPHRYDPRRYREALEFALRAHEGQFRKGSDIPYITHPVGVSAILAQYGYEENLVIAGLLHDVLEDTVVTATELEKGFGEDVASVVRGVTEEKTDARGLPRPWEIRKEEAVWHAGLAEEQVVALKAADALHNVCCLVRDIRMSGNGIWARFKRGKEQQLDYYRRLSSVIRERLKGNALALELCAAVDVLERLALESRD
ncbi:MAG: HD domain-containing protein [Firmicutes bacterium]|nr:HD domain-containing protein [Bacillota bacterium]